MTTSRTCFFVSTPWSGTWRLSGLIGRTGAMKAPRSWFDPILVPANGRRLGLSIREPAWPAHYLRAVRAQATDHGVCSLTVMWLHQRWLVQVARDALGDQDCGQGMLDTAVLQEWFCQLSYVWVRSRDLEAQALRWYLSSRPGMTDAQDAPGVDFQEVRWLETSIARQERGWQTFFLLHGIDPVMVHYEDLLTRPAETVDRTLGDLGMAHGRPISGLEVTGSAIERSAVRWSSAYREARARLHATVGVRGRLHDN